jgi:DNA replication protein DnaC
VTSVGASEIAVLDRLFPGKALVQAICREVLKAGFLVLYRSIFDLVRELLTQETQVAESRLLNKYLKPDLLIID